MDPARLDSIDGLGMTFEHLTPSAQRLALFRANERMRAGQLSDEQRAAIGDALTKAKDISDANQRVLRGLAGPAALPTPAGDSTS